MKVRIATLPAYIAPTDENSLYGFEQIEARRRVRRVRVLDDRRVACENKVDILPGLIQALVDFASTIVPSVSMESEV